MKKFFGVMMLVLMCFALCPVSTDAGSAVPVSTSVKGLQIDYGMISDVDDLGIEKAFMNICFEQILSLNPTAEAYEYKGKTYYFNERVVQDFDTIIKQLWDRKISVAVAFLNKYEPGFEYLICPGVTVKSGVINYAFNTSTEEGKNTVEAVCHFIAGRYNGGEHGMIHNFVIGNEVNDNGQYNYVGSMEIDEYVSVYYDTFKVFYDAIKEEHVDSEIYIPLEHRWTTENTMTDYAAKDFIDLFNELDKKKGKLDWNIAFHAYSYPLSNANVLLDGQPSVDADGNITYGDEVLDTEDSPLITMKNIHVLTDYLSKDEFLTSTGEYRSIILSEQGYTSNSNITGENETLQAASIAFGFYTAEMNPRIDAFILNGHTDSYTENEFYKFGLWNVEDGEISTRKKAYNMYKYIDTNYSLDVTEFALETLGADSWEEVIDYFDWKRIEQFKEVENGFMYSIESMTQTEGQKSMAPGMIDSWKPEYNVHDLSIYDHAGNYFPKGTAVANENANYLSVQSLRYDFGEDADFSSRPCIGFTIGFSPRNSTDLEDEVIVRVRFYSRGNIYDANCSVLVKGNTHLFVDLSDWKHVNLLEKVSIWIQKSNDRKSYDGVFTIYDFVSAAGLEDAKKLERSWDTEPIILEAIPFEATKYGGVDYKDVFDPAFYVEKNTDIEASVGKSPVFLLEHFVKTGMVEGRKSCRTFDLDAYKKYNPDLLEAFGENNKKYYIHYMEHGKAEGRTAIDLGEPEEPEQPGDVVVDAVFDAEYYYNNNPDVAGALGKDEKALLQHFLNCGMKEGRQAIETFNVHVYLNNNPDLRGAFGDDLASYYMHYQNFGRAEGRVAHEDKPTVLDGVNYSAVYNKTYYMQNNPDLAVLGDNSEVLLRHFVNYGMGECRRGNAEFDLYIYMANYEDLRNAFGAYPNSYYLHYVNCGKAEGRVADHKLTPETPSMDYSAVFDANYYYEHNDDVAAAIGRDEAALLNHFVNYGMSEGRVGSAEFVLQIYMEKYSDLCDAFGNDYKQYYIHFIEYGRAEGRSAEVDDV